MKIHSLAPHAHQKQIKKWVADCCPEMSRTVACFRFSGWSAVCHSGHRVYPKLPNPHFEAIVAMGEIESSSGYLPGGIKRTFWSPPNLTPLYATWASKQMGAQPCRSTAQHASCQCLSEQNQPLCPWGPRWEQPDMWEHPKTVF